MIGSQLYPDMFFIVLVSFVTQLSTSVCSSQTETNNTVTTAGTLLSEPIFQLPPQPIIAQSRQLTSAYEYKNNDYSTPNYQTIISTMSPNSWNNNLYNNRYANYNDENNNEKNPGEQNNFRPDINMKYEMSSKNHDQNQKYRNKNGIVKSEIPIFRPDQRYSRYGQESLLGDYDDFDNHHGDSNHHANNDQRHQDWNPPIHYQQLDHHYQHPHYNNHHQKEDLISKLGILTIIKLIFAKFKTIILIKLGLIIFFLIKVPLILLKLKLKLLVFLKLFKLLKLTLLPLLLIPLLPLLLFLPLLLIPLAPLLLIPFLLPLLLPLLLLLPIPVRAPPPPQSAPPQAAPTLDSLPVKNRKPRTSDDEWLNVGATDELIMLTRRVLESEQCMEKLACDIAKNQTPKPYATMIIWFLENLQLVAPDEVHGRLASYTNAFKMGAKSSRNCVSAAYACEKPPIQRKQINLKSFIKKVV